MIPVAYSRVFDLSKVILGTKKAQAMCLSLLLYFSYLALLRVIGIYQNHIQLDLLP